jgi:Mrp family chromosome partitioning ATPase
MNDQSDFNWVLRIARRRWVWLVLTPVLCSIAAFALARSESDVYQADAEIRIVGNDIETDVALITSQEVNAAARDRLGAMTNEVLSVDASTIDDTQLARITVRAATPEVAALAANEWAAAFADVRNEGQTADLLAERDGLLEAAELLVPELLDIEERIAALESIEEPTAETRSELADLRSRKSLLESQQRNVIDRATVIQTQLVTTPVIVTTTNQATEPQSPAEPRPMQQALFGLFGGLFLGALAAALAELLDDRIWEPSHLASASGGLPVLASVPPLRGVQERGSKPITLTAPEHPASETFAMFGRTMRWEESLRSCPVIVMSSAMPDDGTPAVASNVAVVFAQLGERVILVDWKLREQNRMTAFDADRAEGIADAVRSGKPIMDYVRPIDDIGPGSLSVLSTGTGSFDPGALAASTDMKGLVDYLRSRFDRVVIDAGAILVGTETVSVAEDGNGVCLMVRYRSTRRRDVERALGRLDQVGVPKLGVIVWDAPTDLYLVGPHARLAPLDRPMPGGSNGQDSDQDARRASWQA